MEKKTNTVMLSEIEIGKTFKAADGVERILLDRLPDGTALTLTKDFLFYSRFDDDTSNYAKSSLKKRLETEGLPKLEEAVGSENIVEFEIDLTSDDGLDTYGRIKTKYGLLTDAQYRKYSRIIHSYPVDEWWWTATPFSTPERGHQYLVRCVAGGGDLDYDDGSYGFGVRAVCILKSDIFVSE